MNRFLTTLTALFLISLNIFSQWEQTSAGINGGGVFSLIVNEDIIYAACNQINSSGAGYIYRTTNEGLDWTASRVGNYWIKCLAENEGKIFAGTMYDGLYQSTDNGLKWTKNPLNVSSIWSICVLGNKVIATGDYGTYISVNNGSNWNIFSNYTGRILKVSGNKIYSGSNNGVYQSLDSGMTWSPILSNISPVEGLDVFNNYIHAGSYSGIYRSTNMGQNWNLTGFGWTLVPSLISYENIAISGTGGFGVWYSTNSGATYAQSNITNITAYAFMRNNNKVFAGFSGSGVYVSTNNGSYWIQSELHNVRILSLFEAGNEMFAGVVDKGIYSSANSGYNWSHKSFQYEDIGDFVSNQNKLFASTLNDGLFYSTNNGTNWIHNSLPANEVYFIDKFGNDLYSGTGSGGIFRSTNNGVNWQRLGLNFNKVRAFSFHNGIMFVGAENENPGYLGVKYSTNMGRSWINSVFGGHRVLNLLSSNNVLFACTESSGIFKTTDNGLSWTSLEIGSTDVNCILDVNNYLICGTGRGVYYSSNSGNNWVYLNNGLDSQRVYSLMVSGNYLYAGTEANAVWKLDVSQIIGVNQISTEIPLLYKLHQNYPNPFNPKTTIKFEIPDLSIDNITQIKVYDVSGRLVQKLIDQKIFPGIYSVSFDGSTLASGVYFYTLETGNFREYKKMILIK